jgi:hypothetical protein
MRQIIKYNIPLLLVYLLGMLSFSSCVKSRGGLETDFGNLNPIVQIPEGGFANFGSQALTFPGTDNSDTVFFYVNFAATKVAPKDVMIKLGYDANALTNYNSANPGQQPYAKFPDSIYSFTTQQVTIKAGQSYSVAIPFVIYPSKIDPTKNYMLPISITDASGTKISGNFGTIYYHLIGNPIAGAYSWDWTRWNNSTGTGSPTSSSFTGHSTIFAPDDPTTVEVPSGYFSQPRYVITFDNNGGVLSNFRVSLNAADVAQYFPSNGLTISSGPNIIKADPINHVYIFQYSVSTSSGSSRYLIDKFYK